MESIQTNALNSKYINSLLRPEENPFMQEMQSFEGDHDDVFMCHQRGEDKI